MLVGVAWLGGVIMEARLREKLSKIEALHAGAGTPGERDAAEAALLRLRARLAAETAAEVLIEMKFSLGDEWSRRLFLALCRRTGSSPTDIAASAIPP